MHVKDVSDKNASDVIGNYFRDSAFTGRITHIFNGNYIVVQRTLASMAYSAPPRRALSRAASANSAVGFKIEAVSSGALLQKLI